MRTTYVVRAIPVRNTSGAIVGWVRADPFADGSEPTDIVILRDGSAIGQAEAIRRVNEDRSLLYETEEDAVRDGFHRLGNADRRGELTFVPR